MVKLLFLVVAFTFFILKTIKMFLLKTYKPDVSKRFFKMYFYFDWHTETIVYKFQKFCETKREKRQTKTPLSFRFFHIPTVNEIGTKTRKPWTRLHDVIFFRLGDWNWKGPVVETNSISNRLKSRCIEKHKSNRKFVKSTRTSERLEKHHGCGQWCFVLPGWKYLKT